MGPLNVILLGHVKPLKFIVAAVFTINPPVPVTCIPLPSVTLPETVIPKVIVIVPVNPVPLLKSNTLQTMAAFTVGVPELLLKNTVSDDVGTAPVAPPPSVRDQLEAVFVLPVTFLKY